MRSTPEQRTAIESTAREVLVEAGAGTGKTRVLVERCCDALERAAAEGRGIDAVLAFTFTERAAAELRQRVRAELALRARLAGEAGDAERAALLARVAADSERAWISTIHGFCRRLIAAHPAALGLDPRFRVLDAAEADRVAARAFADALERFLEGDDPERARFAGAMGAGGLRALVLAAHDELRSQGLQARLPDPEPIDPARAIAALAAAAASAVAETEGGRGGPANRERLARAAALEPARLPTLAELDALKLASKARAFAGPRCAAYREAWAAARAAVAERELSSHYGHVGELLELFATRYRELKDDRSGLDFEDLQLEARRLLSEHEAVATPLRDRLRDVLIDELQDTNRLQLELVGLLRGPDTRVFGVGDELQSIYGFRHADLEVFRAERERLGRLPASQAAVLPLSGNFRSTPQVVAAANAIRSALLPDSAELTVGDVRSKRGDDPATELLLTPAGAAWKGPELGIDLPGDYPSSHDRVAEARYLAARLRGLVSEGARRADIVVLLRAFTHVAAFEEELERAGLRPYVVGGRGFWSAQQVDDVRRLLGVLANPLDEECLLGALASPACGVLPDTLWLLRRACARPRGHLRLWQLVEATFGPNAKRDGSGPPTQLELGGQEEAEEAAAEASRREWLAAIPADDVERLRSFAARVLALRERAGSLALEELAERAVADFGYDLAVLGLDRGRRRWANVRKLMRLAREFEATEGRDLRGFLDFLAERADAGREGEAATDAEDHDGVRVMTVHAAKGLEFPVVAVADLGRELTAGGRPPSVIVGESRVGIKMARFGATAIGVFGYDELLERAAADEAAESCRLAYVAATRARDRLLLSGRYGEPREGSGEELPARTPVTDRLIRHLRLTPGEDATVEVATPSPRPGLRADLPLGRIEVRFNRPDPGAFRALRVVPPAADPADQPQLAPAPLARPAASDDAAAGHLSYSALAAYGRCGYRFFAERVVGLPATEPANGGGSGLRAARFAFGSAVHALLEWSARARWREPGIERCREMLRREGLPADPEQVERAARMISGWLASELGTELAKGRVRPELPFVLPLGGSVVRGSIDLLVPGDVPLVVDYKTDRLGDASLEELVDRYGVQRWVYALAAAQGAEAVRTAYVFLERPDEPVVAELGRTELRTARLELEAMIGGIRAGRFEVTPRPHAALCWDCPARAHLCSHPPEATLGRLEGEAAGATA